MSESETRLSTRVPFDTDGKHTGFIELPHSVHRSAYGYLPIPFTVIRNGDGPTALLIAGTHGDEYEGQVVLGRLIRDLEASHVKGRLIILPAANLPAAKAGLRTSPIDDLNLNRVYPGDPAGTPTLAIAHYVETVLMPKADYVFDLHSGGSSLMYLPTVIVPFGEAVGDEPRNVELAKVWGAPYALSMPANHAGGNTFNAAARNGLPGLGTEFGGSGAVTRAYADICETGLRRVLGHVGILTEGVPAAPETPTRMIAAPNHDYFCYATEDGLFEPLVELGDTVEAGQPAALIHTPDAPWRAPTTVSFAAAGLVVCKRVPGRTERGDCLFHLGA